MIGLAGDVNENEITKFRKKASKLSEEKSKVICWCKEKELKNL